MQQNTGDAPALRKVGTFSQEDYRAPTMDIVHAQMGLAPGGNSQEKRSFAAVDNDITITIPKGKRKRLAHKGRGHKRSPFVVVSALIVTVLSAMAATVFFFVFPQTASASVSISPQVHALQQVYTITARSSQTGIDVADAAIPLSEKDDSQTGSQTGQTTGMQCDFFFRCNQVVSAADVENLSFQVRQSLIPQLTAEMDGQLQALHDTVIGSKQFTDTSVSSNPETGTVSNTVTVTLTEQVSVEYVNSSDVQQLARQLLAQKLGPNTILVNSTIQIGQPVVEGVDNSGTVTMKVAAAGVEEYQYPSAQLQIIQNHIKGMTLTGARAYLQQQPGVDANTVSISVHTMFGSSDTLPSNASQIKITFVNPTNLPTASLPVVATPVASPDGSMPDM